MPAIKQDEGEINSLSEEIAAIERLLAIGADHAVGDRIQLARRRWPADLRLRFCEASWLEKSGHTAEAEARLHDARAVHPQNPWPPVRLLELYLRQSDGERAATVFREAVWSGGAPEPSRTFLLARTITLLADPAARRSYLESLLRGANDDRFVLMKLAALSARERDRGGAEALLAKARAFGPLTDESLQIEFDLLFSSARFEKAYAIARELQVRNPDRVEFARRSIQAAIFSHRMEVMTELLSAALTRWPADWLLLFRYNRCPLSGVVDRALFAVVARQAEMQAGDQRWLFQFAVACMRHGETDRAIDILVRLRPDGPAGNMAAPLAAALVAHPRATWSNPRGVSNACDDDVQIVRTPDAVATIVLFSSVAGGLGYLPFGLADGLLRRRPVNVVFLRDRNHRSFTSGVATFGADREAMIRELGKVLSELGVPVVTMGSSVAGVAAIRAATMMGARAAVSFAGPVNLGVDATDDASPPAAADGMRTSLYSSFNSSDPSIADLIRGAPDTTVHQCFGAGFMPDVEAARLLDGLANVRCHAEPGCDDHFVIEHVIANGRFFAILDAAIGLSPGSP